MNEVLGEDLALNRLETGRGNESNVELIIKYSGDLITAVSELNAIVEILSESYAIITLPIENIDTL